MINGSDATSALPAPVPSSRLTSGAIYDDFVLFTAYQLFCPTLLGPTLVQWFELGHMQAFIALDSTSATLSHFLNTPAYDLSKLWSDPPIAQDERCCDEWEMQTGGHMHDPPVAFRVAAPVPRRRRRFPVAA
ncbi:hypothetical protein B0H13DRAFT_2655569 [Mycena leptocephala]|nr:hypothetical protein B0H13DRAFT_2655569 [Mycena leptocephala]